MNERASTPIPDSQASRAAQDPGRPGAGPKRLGRRPNVVRALTPEEIERAGRVARRLHGEIRGMLALIPEGERGASALARAFSIDRATCQRMVATAAAPTVSPALLVQFPGVQGMRQLLAKLHERYTDLAAQERLAAAGAAVDHLDAFFRETGGSQRLFRQRLEASGALGGQAAPGRALVPGQVPLEHERASELRGDGPGDEIGTREALYRAAVGVTGRWSEATIHASIIRPVPDEPTRTEAVRLRALIGHAWVRSCVPLEIGETVARQHPPAQRERDAAFVTLDSIPASGRTQSSLMARFCSEPLPRVISRASGARVVHVIEPPEGVESGPMDIVTAHRSAQPDPHPATLRPAIGELWALQNFPAQRLVFDTFIHREIARRCIPSLEVHLWTPGVSQHAASRWSTRFPTGPRLEVLGAGVDRVATEGYARYGELLGSVYEQLGWEPNEFIGYRCEVLYPLWRAGYCMIFDFTGNEMQAAT